MMTTTLHAAASPGHRLGKLKGASFQPIILHSPMSEHDDDIPMRPIRHNDDGARPDDCECLFPCPPRSLFISTLCAPSLVWHAMMFRGMPERGIVRFRSSSCTRP